MIHYNPKGLTSQEVDESRQRHGDNVITPPKDDSVWRLLLEKFRDPIIRILLLAAVLSLAIGFIHKDFTESVGIICAIILATCVGFWFEWDAQRRFRRLNQVNDDIPVKVMREGSIREIPRRDVVTGDVVYIEKLDQEAGATVKFDQVLAIIDGEKATFGTPVVEGASVEATVEKNKSEVKAIGKRMTGHKTTGANGTGSMTLYYMTPLFRELIRQWKETGVDVYFDMVVENDDEESAAGKQTVLLIDCNLDSVILAKLDGDSDDALDEDADFTFEDFDILKAFNQI